MLIQDLHFAGGFGQLGHAGIQAAHARAQRRCAALGLLVGLAVLVVTILLQLPAP